MTDLSLEAKLRDDLTATQKIAAAFEQQHLASAAQARLEADRAAKAEGRIVELERDLAAVSVRVSDAAKRLEHFDRVEAERLSLKQKAAELADELAAVTGRAAAAEQAAAEHKTAAAAAKEEAAGLKAAVDGNAAVVAQAQAVVDAHKTISAAVSG